jgi:hypothetical protein
MPADGLGHRPDVAPELAAVEHETGRRKIGQSAG